MLRSAFVVFITGWVAWFWLDKPPSSGRFRLPQAGDNLLENFQRAFDMLKAGYAEMAFVYIWPAHYIILSLLGGVIVGMAWQSIGRYFSFHRREYRARKRAIAGGASQPPEAETKEKGHGD